MANCTESMKSIIEAVESFCLNEACILGFIEFVLAVLVMSCDIFIHK